VLEGLSILLYMILHIGDPEMQLHSDLGTGF
jgi:hypothetical protein